MKWKQISDTKIDSTKVVEWI